MNVKNSDTALDPRCQSGPSARNSFDPIEGKLSKDYVADQQRLQISDFHFDDFPAPTSFACWKRICKTEVCTCQFPTEAMLWIKEVEMVKSVNDLKSSRSLRGTHGPNFELLDVRNASALHKIIQNTRFKKKVSLEEMKAHKEDRFLRGRQIAYLICKNFRVTGPMILSKQKPKTKTKMKDAKKYKAIYCMICQIGCRIFKKNSGG